MEEKNKMFSSDPADHPEIFEKKKEEKEQRQVKINESLLKQFQEIYQRKKNAKQAPKELIEKRTKIKKAARRASNKSRKINQEKNRHNKFTK